MAAPLELPHLEPRAVALGRSLAEGGQDDPRLLWVGAVVS